MKNWGFIWMRDPKSREPSFTYGLAVLSTLAMLISIGLELSGRAKGTTLITEFFFGSIGAYVGRRFSFGRGSAAGPLEENGQ